MDASRFDRWTRQVAGAAPRRHALKSLAGGAFAGLLVLVGAEEASAACKANNKECERDRQCCSFDCRNNQCRCARVQDRCRSAKGCCQGGGPTVCKPVPGFPGDRCCREKGDPCDGDSFDCCGSLLCNVDTCEEP